MPRSAWVYLERFRGDPDPASALQERLDAADTLASIVAGWARARLGDRRGFDRLGTYLDGDFHRDLKDLSLFTWTTGPARDMRTLQPPSAPGPSAENELASLSSAQLDIVAVALQYLVERKYVDLQDVPIVMRILRDLSP